MIACAQFDREAREIQSLGEIARSPLGHQKNFQIRREKKLRQFLAKKNTLQTLLTKQSNCFSDKYSPYLRFTL